VIRVSAQLLPGGVRLSIADDGIGVAPKDQAKIFELFERVVPPQPGQKGRRGIGLTFARRAIHRMGGLIGVESELGKGCVFWIDLPSVPGAPGVASAPPP
jgi:signal transduction histidine kinase